MSDTASVFAEIVKTSPQEDGSLLVQGRACDSSLDLDQQICDPKWLARAMPAWFEIGNIREQHDPRRAVGKATEYDARSDGHFITAKIVDPVAKAKTEAGIFTGFSIGVKGPRVAKSQSAPGGVIHDGKIVEVSLVDRPANAGCSLTLVKAAAPGWEGSPADLDEERGLVHVEELHLAEDSTGDSAGDMDADVAAAVLGIDTLAALLDVPAEGKAAALADAIEKGTQADDIAGANDAIATIGGLIASEASELVTCPSEAYDISLLLEAVRALQRFIRCEENEDRRHDDGPVPAMEMGAEADLGKRKWSAEERRRAAKAGHARPDGSFPIETAEDVDAAVQVAKEKDRAWVKQRAKAIGAMDKIPDTWKGAMSDTTIDKTTADDGAAGQPTTPEGGDPAAEKAQPPSMTAPGDQEDPNGDADQGDAGEQDGEAEKGDNPFAKKPAGKKNGDGPKDGDEDEDGEESDEDDKPTAKKPPAKKAADTSDDEDGDAEGGATKADSPDLVKALTTALNDTDSELRKTLTAIVEDSTKSTAAALEELAGRVEQVEQMATPGGPALRRNGADRATARHADLSRQASHFKALAASSEDMDLRRGYHAKAAQLDAEMKALGTALTP